MSLPQKINIIFDDLSQKMIKMGISPTKMFQINPRGGFSQSHRCDIFHRCVSDAWLSRRGRLPRGPECRGPKLPEVVHNWSKSFGTDRWDMDVSKNRRFYPKSSILIGFSIINHPFWGYHYFWKNPYGWDLETQYFFLHLFLGGWKKKKHGPPNSSCLKNIKIYIF